MTDPDRLSDRAAGVSGHLLRSARDDAPSNRARIRTAAALGVAVGGAAAGTATTATAAASASASKMGAYGGTLALVKWFGLGALGATIAVGAVESVIEPAAPSTTVATSRSPAPRPSGKPLDTTRAEARGPAPLASALGPAPTVATPSLVSATAPAVVGTAPANSLALAPPRATAVASSLANELRALDRASKELAAGNPRAALDALDSHEVFFKDAALGPEAAVLRIEALAAIGDDDAATRDANAFLSADPDSVQARRVRSVLSAIETKRNRDRIERAAP